MSPWTLFALTDSHVKVHGWPWLSWSALRDTERQGCPETDHGGCQRRGASPGGFATEGGPAEVRGVGVGEGPASASAPPADLLLESEVLFWRVWPTHPGVAPSLPKGGVRPAGTEPTPGLSLEH